jgi:hypothetical protein
VLIRTSRHGSLNSSAASHTWTAAHYEYERAESF